MSKSIYRKIMDSKAMDMLEVVGDVCVEFIKTTAEVIHDTFDHPCGSPQPQFGNGYSYEESDVEKRTYEYWANMPCDAQEYYFSTNYKLQEYGENYIYYGDREATARSIAKIARKENRDFCNLNNKY